jgi:tetratricopeptide (TPR) repeat protein
VTNESVDPLIGRTVAQYQILAKLGGGGMGVVYQARDTRLGRVVALKFLPHQWSHDADAKQRFVREAQAASATDHRNICTIHDIATADDGQLFIVMAYYEGPTLKQRLEAGALPVDEALDIATQIAEGLARAHAHGVVHRDVKPGNLILAEDGVRIVDFGLATFADALQLTIAGSTLGTAAYMSPEQVRGDAVDARTDVWAAGVILHQMLSGHPPFRGVYAEAIAYAIRNEPPPPLREVRPEIPEEVEQLVFRALHKDPAVRFQSGRELARALRQVRGQTLPMDLRTEAVAAPSSVSMAARQPPGWRRARLVAGAALVAVLAGAGWMLRPPPRLPIVIVPVANQTGAADLDAYQLAMTQQIVHELADSPVVRPLSWSRTLETLRGFIERAVGLSSNEVVNALRKASPGSTLVRPVLLDDGKGWLVKLEIIDAATGVAVRTLESVAVAPSVLHKPTAHDLMAAAVARIQSGFDRRWIGAAAAPRPSSARFLTLDVAAAFAEGLRWYDDQEYPAAYDAFQRAAAEDVQNPLVHAWVSRAARAIRRDADAARAAGLAVTLLQAQTPTVDRLLVEASAAEGTRDPAAARQKYEALRDRFPDDSQWSVELAAFEDRTAEDKEGWTRALLELHRAMEIDPGLIRGRVEICRLYNRLQDTQNAVTAGQLSLEASMAVAWQGGEAQSRLCLSDALRQRGDTERAEALPHAEKALAILQASSHHYNVPRALLHLGNAAYALGRLRQAGLFWTEGERAAAAVDNRLVLPIVLSNLGVVQQLLGDGALASGSFARSIAAYEDLGDERRAARQQMNLAATRIRYGEHAEEGLEQVLEVREVMRARGDPEFEALSTELIGDYYRIAGRYATSSTELHKAFELAQQQSLAQRIRSATLALARLRFEEGQYAEAMTRLKDAVGKDQPRGAPEAWIALARVHTRLGDFGQARRILGVVAADRARDGDAPLEPFFNLVLGELAYESDRLGEARVHFSKASSFWRDSFNIEAAVEARAYLGLLDALDGRAVQGRAGIQSSLDHARRMGRVALEGLCRVMLARAYLLEGRRADALRELADVSKAPSSEIGRELLLHVRYWQGQARAAEGGPSASDTAEARRLLDAVQSSLPGEYRRTFLLRRDIRLMSG